MEFIWRTDWKRTAARLAKAYEKFDVTLGTILLAIGHRVSSADSRPCQWIESLTWDSGLQAGIAKQDAHCHCVQEDLVKGLEGRY